jgi:hypothetical protein
MKQAAIVVAHVKARGDRHLAQVGKANDLASSLLNLAESVLGWSRQGCGIERNTLSRLDSDQSVIIALQASPTVTLLKEHSLFSARGRFRCFFSPPRRFSDPHSADAAA